MKIPIVKADNGCLAITVEKSLYSKVAIDAACYKYTDKYHIFQQLSKENNCIDILFETKDSVPITDRIVKDFCNELIDQQVRYNTNNQFGHIRDLIVEEAFKPVS